ncbi:hypothetical protein [Streptomyces sp. ME18-1-4]|uniref:hypothetical protein n=1 Tax=Streptomyces sp. ME18-1-4 TaxID=3028685 RepID=UPI0029B73A55|nr:hypothetical protein [Streptomyces sp. ME18-1-4]MDX3247186.1 hypothetical protein [Streptomyces sp. ME18-1-4]
MSRLTRILRQLARDWTDGLRAGIDVLLWGHAYPRTIDLQTLKRLRRRQPTA